MARAKLKLRQPVSEMLQSCEDISAGFLELKQTTITILQGVLLEEWERGIRNHYYTPAGLNYISEQLDKSADALDSERERQSWSNHPTH